MNNEVTIVDVQGNISAGKSTTLEKTSADPTNLVRLLFKDTTQYTHVCVVPEPIGQWTSVGVDETDLLQAQSDDAAAHGFTCQLNIVNTTLAAISDAMRAELRRKPPQPAQRVQMLVLTERSTDADKHIFASSLRDKRLISAAQWKVYCDSFDAAHALWRESVRAMFPGGVSVHGGGTILLLVTPEEALKRANARGREAEKKLSIELLDNFDKRHRQMYEKRNSLVQTRVAIVDSNMLAAVLSKKLKETSLLVKHITPAKT